jgi:uncharacterized Zn-finger protein
METMSQADAAAPSDVFVTNAARVFCDGDERGGDGHPRVWLQIGGDGDATCGYCGRHFVLAGSAADKRVIGTTGARR